MHEGGAGPLALRLSLNYRGRAAICFCAGERRDPRCQSYWSWRNRYTASTPRRQNNTWRQDLAGFAFLVRLYFCRKLRQRFLPGTIQRRPRNHTPLLQHLVLLFHRVLNVIRTLVDGTVKIFAFLLVV